MAPVVTTDIKLEPWGKDLNTINEMEIISIPIKEDTVEDTMEEALKAEEQVGNGDAKKHRPRTMHKIKLTLENGTKNLGRQTASLVSTMGNWTSSILKHDKVEKDDQQSQASDVESIGLVEKYASLTRKMKTLLKIGDDGKSVKDEQESSVDIEVP